MCTYLKVFRRRKDGYVIKIILDIEPIIWEKGKVLRMHSLNEEK